MFSKLFNRNKKDKEVSKGGSQMHRYKSPTGDLLPSYGDERETEAIEKHIEKYVGEIKSVYHEIVSEYTHVDVYWVAPTKERNFHTLITSGMSFKPMNVPKGMEEYKYGELMLCLPPEWKLSQEDFKDENNYWPIRWLKILASLPHEYNSWLTRGHTIPNGENEDPFASNTKLSGMYITFPIHLPTDFIKFQVSPKKTIWFYSVIPLYSKEMKYKLDKGSDALEELFDKNKVSELLNPKRPSII